MLLKATYVVGIALTLSICAIVLFTGTEVILPIVNASRLLRPRIGSGGPCISGQGRRPRRGIRNMGMLGS